MLIYWANSIFSEADRRFNSVCVESLRAEGFSVMNPQERNFNLGDSGKTVDAALIFRQDTTDVEKCDVLIACIDQETIDCGVSCEVGIAWTLKKKTIGLYTDFRQHRVGEGKMYKNPYVLGCILDHGIILNTVDQVVEELRRMSKQDEQ
jgi:nucleoside 2-deoxyribosyltransferase